MPSYAFETITAVQALAILGTDTLTFSSGAANQVAVLFDPASPVAPGGTISVVAGGRTVTFGVQLATLSQGGRLQTSDGARIFVGDSGPNTASAPDATANDAIYGGGGDDVLEGGTGDDLLQGNAGRDYIVGGPGSDVIYGGQDDDHILSSIVARPDIAFPANEGGFAQGNKGNDTIEGTLGADTLLGGQGNDLIAGFGDRADVLNGNLGDDRVGGSGLLLGEGGDDTLVGNSTADTLMGGDGNDRIFTRGGYADGGEGADRIELGQGAGGDNTARGGDGADTISAINVSNVRTLHQTIYGDEGNDSLEGSVWSDTLTGGSGNDTLSGLGGRDAPDVVSGGAGEDLFVIFNGIVDAVTGAALDAARIIDWQVTDSVTFRVGGFPAASSANYREIVADSFTAANKAAADLRSQGVFFVAAQVGGDVALIGASPVFQGGSALLVGRSLSDIGFENFV